MSVKYDPKVVQPRYVILQSNGGGHFMDSISSTYLFRCGNTEDTILALAPKSSDGSMNDNFIVPYFFNGGSHNIV